MKGFQRATDFIFAHAFQLKIVLNNIGHLDNIQYVPYRERWIDREKFGKRKKERNVKRKKNRSTETEKERASEKKKGEGGGGRHVRRYEKLYIDLMYRLR